MRTPGDPIPDTLFDALPEAERADILALGRDAEFHAGQTIFARGDAGGFLLRIAMGRVEVSVTHLSGRKSVLAHLGPGEILGEIALLDGRARSADAVAITPVTGRVIARGVFLAHLETRPALVRYLIETLCLRVRNASDMFEGQSLGSGSERLARCLVRLDAKWGVDTEDGRQVGEAFTQAELGDFAGIARENVNRHLRAWAQEGYLSYDRGTLVLHDLAALETLAGL